MKKEGKLLTHPKLSQGRGLDLFTVLRSHTAEHALRARGVTTVEDLTKLKLTDVIGMNGVGYASFQKMEQLLHARGLDWAPRPRR